MRAENLFISGNLELVEISNVKEHLPNHLNNPFRLYNIYSYKYSFSMLDENEVADEI